MLPADGDLPYGHSDTQGCSDGMSAPVSCMAANVTFAEKRPDGDRLLTLLPFMVSAVLRHSPAVGAGRF